MEERDDKKLSLEELIALQKIEDRVMEKEVKNAFIEYSMSVITSRALPDVRDGMKPGQRRILYAMYEDHLTYDKPFRKSATTVGNVLGRYHPHGDAAVYQTMVRMAQAFSLRYPLVEGHGNFGNVDGDPPAAYRYTEARMSRLADEMLRDIEKNVVPMTRNFDNTRDEPTVLPSRFPNILVNGSVGIAVGMATNIPPHNLVEVVDGTLYRMDHPECTVADLMQYIKGPDFPTRGIIYGSAGLYHAYATGHGRIYVRARAKVEEEHHRIIITEIPYMVNKSQLITAMADLVKDKKIEGITGLRDESGRGGMRIVVEYRRDANGEVILNQLYKYTQLQDTCAINMLALVGGEPKILSLPEILDLYIAHQMSVITNRTQYDLDRALREMHIFEGYQIAIDHIDEVIALIKASASIPDAKAGLMDAFGLTDPQAQAIVEMTLGRLSGLERQKVEERLAKLRDLVAHLEGILADEGKVKEIIREEMTAIRDRFGDDRRTEIVEAGDDIDIEDLIEKHTCIITMTHSGYIKRQRADIYTAQHRGGKGIIGMTTKEEDFVENMIVANSHAYLLMFTNLGKVYAKKVYRIPEAGRNAKGTNIVNILELAEGEKLTAVIPITEFSEGEYLTMVTRQGVIKRTLLKDFEFQRKSGKIAVTLDEGDELLYVRHTVGDGQLILATHDGQAVRFSEESVRSMGRTARGVRGIRLSEGDFVIGVAVVTPEKKLLTLTEKGYGKRTDFDDFRVMLHRGGMGVTCQNLTDKTGKLASIAAVSEDDDIMIITSDGTIIRTPAKDINCYSRTATGVIVMRPKEGSLIYNFTCLPSEEQIEAEAEVALEEDARAEMEEALKETGDAFDEDAGGEDNA
ncbi:MAG: DNA gyrase subunit A [Clostridia bacterium]|nr:DNA gyrase subunit A [Clostridia bacterium]MDY6184019.1 DNA gyrase subunit A [Eubacteriales bacterium]